MASAAISDNPPPCNILLQPNSLLFAALICDKGCCLFLVSLGVEGFWFDAHNVGDPD